MSRDTQAAMGSTGVLGDDIIEWGTQLFCTRGTDRLEVPMHQDGQHWPIEPLATCTIRITGRVATSNVCRPESVQSVALCSMMATLCYGCYSRSP